VASLKKHGAGNRPPNWWSFFRSVNYYTVIFSYVYIYILYTTLVQSINRYVHMESRILCSYHEYAIHY